MAYNAVLFFQVFSIVTITSGILTRFYLSLMYDNNDNINGNLFESFSFTTQCLIVIGVVMILVSLVSCSILINDEIQTILTVRSTYKYTCYWLWLRFLKFFVSRIPRNKIPLRYNFFFFFCFHFWAKFKSKFLVVMLNCLTLIYSMP